MGEKINVTGSVVVRTENSEYNVQFLHGRKDPMHRVEKTVGADDSAYPVGWTTEGNDLHLVLGESLRIGSFRSSPVQGVCSADLDFCSSVDKEE